MRVLAVGAHPDDIEMYCSGTLLRCRERGDEIRLCCLTNGDKGHYHLMPEELAVIRKKEAQAAAEIIGGEIMFLDLPDAETFICEDHRARVIDAVRWAAPDMIITHPPEDYHQDHRNASELVFSASFFATAPHIPGSRDFPSHCCVPPVFYNDTPVGNDFSPTEYVDISDQLETKLEIIACHKSQLEWLREHDNIDLIRVARVMAEFRGLQCGVAAAEGFRQLTTWPRMKAHRMLP